MNEQKETAPQKLPLYYNPWLILILAIMGGISQYFSVLTLTAIILLILRNRKFTLTSKGDIDHLFIMNLKMEKVRAENLRLRKIADEQIAFQQDKINHQAELEKIRKDIALYSKQLQDIEDKVDAVISSPEIDTSVYEDMTSSEIKNELMLLSNKEKELLKNDKATVRTKAANTMKDSEIRKQRNQLLRGFNAEVDNLVKDVTVRNLDTIRNRINRAYEAYNKLFENDGLVLSGLFLKSKLARLECFYQYQLKLAHEKELLQAQKEQIREEEKVRREIEAAKKKIARDESQFHNEINRLMAYMQKSSLDVEKQLYADKIKELEEKLSQLEKEKTAVATREENAKAGFVYIISNIGSFGEGIYKIGMTRRLEPMDRIKELSSASVPFEFDVHAIIFSDNAPELESILHQKFRNYEVNKINHRKEFFKVALDEIEKTVKENYNNTVTFIRVPKAEEYRESLRLAMAESNEA